MFTTSTSGLGIKTGLGPRDTRGQSAFRNSLKQFYAAENDAEELWDPILADFFPPEHCTAAHIFPVRHGQDVITAFFGEECKEDLFSATNGLILNDILERRFDSGLLVIVPGVEDIKPTEDVLS
jgi:HNH endonuclease